MEQEQIVAKITELDNRQKVSEHRIKDLEEKNDRLESLTLSVQKIGLSCEAIAKEQARMSKEADEAKDRQNALADKLLEVQQQPIKAKAEMHDKIVWSIVYTVIVAFLGGFLTYIGLK